ncbi:MULTISPECIES: phosphonate C-P lyase system protein PhnL [unclassified Photobacterium]|uniref:phosphonate C-P lyase system protein PhnL n=1 Tax=unclassified Photobacterium TaxID=2628852 RepID=UPI000D161FBA|nr:MULTISPECIES: phosphonate C-P lyase system protein PhnL [unclassified Photobacterium]PSV33680.1 phosphonate C-P lyase system protein PhnL [Photobacterium sp. GB-210]PSV42043.1 phosphonate C-P lyase system protein PhnL [Photobacterium sp. GB-36]PSV57352.1 phosphonate C-P lyase system protein PhnL [Photobacterium sp. GB-3]
MMNTHNNKVMLRVENISKTFVLHNQSSARISVLDNSSFQVESGECVVLLGHSGSGKSTLLKALYANYLVDAGHILVRKNRNNNDWVDLANTTPKSILEVRKHTVGWVSQFLRVIPRISALDVVSQPLIDLGVDKDEAREKAQILLRRLNVPEALWHLAPATFSGGEQQRVNIARGFIVESPILLLDEPTASLDEKNCQVVVELISEAKHRGAAIVGIFHDESVRKRVADKIYDMSTAQLSEIDH